MERLSGQAWLAKETLLDGVEESEGSGKPPRHLWQELEPLEFLRAFTTFEDFYKSFRRTRGQEFVNYDLAFHSHGGDWGRDIWSDEGLLVSGESWTAN